MHIKNLKNFVLNQNKKKIIFTAGPSSLVPESIYGITPCFGRNDKDYIKTENNVLNKLKTISGHRNIARMQGSGSFALELVCSNFLYGKVLIISTGYYSDRLLQIAKYSKKTFKKINKIYHIDWKKMSKFQNKVDWIWACCTETSKGIKIPISELKKLSKKTKSKLAIDATASFGLEKNHKLADVISFSSCKGLFALTGASFVCFNEKPRNKVNSFILNLDNHLKKKMTGPYHIIQSLEHILKNYNKFKKTVLVNKKKMMNKFKKFLIYEKKNQPAICTYVNCKIKGKNSKVLLYKPRVKLKGSVLCHLGEAHLGKYSKGKILDQIDYD